MVVTTVMTVLCSVGVAFYLRFLVALCKECKHQRICYLVRMPPESAECAIPNTSSPWCKDLNFAGASGAAALEQQEEAQEQFSLLVLPLPRLARTLQHP
jgi:hypothetical protein